MSQWGMFLIQTLTCALRFWGYSIWLICISAFVWDSWCFYCFFCIIQSRMWYSDSSYMPPHPSLLWLSGGLVYFQTNFRFFSISVNNVMVYSLGLLSICKLLLRGRSSSQNYLYQPLSLGCLCIFCLILDYFLHWFKVSIIEVFLLHYVCSYFVFISIFDSVVNWSVVKILFSVISYIDA